LWLNPGVARRPKPKYQLPGQRRGKGGVIRWLFVLAIVAGAAWFWWRHEQHPAQPARVVAPAPVKSTARQRNEATESAGGSPRTAHNVFEAQIALARRGISPGSIDAVPGSQTRRAISVFQETENLPPTGVLDAETGARRSTGPRQIHGAPLE
jgi:hypothetical protein